MQTEVVWSGFYYAIVCAHKSVPAQTVAKPYREAQYKLEDHSPVPCSKLKGHMHYHFGVVRQR